MPLVIQPGGGGGKMRVHFSARRKRGLVATLKRMQAEGMPLRAAASEWRVTPPPAEKLIQNPLVKRSRHAIPRLFQPKPRHLTLGCHIFHDYDWADCSI